jgi:hypothetical protein
MLTRKCCCSEEGGCCEIWLTDQFVTIFGDLMNSAVPVSQGDLISLKINRPTSRTRSRERGWRIQPNTNEIPCNCCCTPNSLNACECCPPTRACVDCPNNSSSNTCGAGTLFAAVNRIGDLGSTPESCCNICGTCN